jgi:hypothetical protein
MPKARRADAGSTDVRQVGSNAASGILLAALKNSHFMIPYCGAVIAEGLAKDSPRMPVSSNRIHNVSVANLGDEAID